MATIEGRQIGDGERPLAAAAGSEAINGKAEAGKFG
jgi:hypothetical protein